MLLEYIWQVQGGIKGPESPLQPHLHVLAVRGNAGEAVHEIFMPPCSALLYRAMLSFSVERLGRG